MEYRSEPGGRPGTEGEAKTGGISRPLLRSEYTWYDHQDRVRFAATYDAGTTAAGATLVRSLGASSSINPRVRDVYTLREPTAAEILATNPKKFSETIYNDRGLLEEERDYDAQHSVDSTGLAYQATRMYYDHMGHVLVRVSASGRWERMFYDALGRLVSTSVMRGEIESAASGPEPSNDYEIERTDNTYNVDGQLERTSHLVRVVLNSTNTLAVSGTSANAVRTDTLTWYDANARVIATASVGTGAPAESPDRPNGTFCNTSADAYPAPSISLEAAPTWNTASPQGWNRGGLPGSAQISTTTYDDSGRVVETRPQRHENHPHLRRAQPRLSPKPSIPQEPAPTKPASPTTSTPSTK